MKIHWNIEFYLARFHKSNNYKQEYYLPASLNIEKLADHLNIHSSGIIGNSNLNMNKMIEIHCKLLIIVLTSLRKLENFKYMLSGIIINENHKNMKLDEIQLFYAQRIKNRELFNLKKYQLEIKLLFSHRNKLNEYDLKTFYYSLNKMNI